MNEDREQLIGFVDRLEKDVFERLAEDGYRILRYDLREIASGAWQEVRGAMQSIRNWLHGQLNVVTESVDSLLAQAGLVGAQLRLKLTGFHGAVDRIAHGYNGLVRWFREVFAWANVVLGSLASVFRPAELVKEYKECMEIGINYAGRAARFG